MLSKELEEMFDRTLAEIDENVRKKQAEREHQKAVLATFLSDSFSNQEKFDAIMQALSTGELPPQAVDKILDSLQKLGYEESTQELDNALAA